MIDSAICDSSDGVHSVQLWESVFRVLKPGSHILVFNSVRGHHRNAVNVEDAGFEIRDSIFWAFQGTKPQYIQPAIQIITLARKPLESTVASNVLKWGTGALNIDGCRVKSSDNPVKWDKPRGGFWETDPNAEGSLQENTMGRWPANFCHDNSYSVVSLFPSSGSGNGKKPYSYKGKEYKNSDTSMFNGDKPISPSNYNDRGNASRYFFSTPLDDSGTMPLGLLRYLCRLITPPGGTVFDPLSSVPLLEKAAGLEGLTFCMDWSKLGSVEPTTESNRHENPQSPQSGSQDHGRSNRDR